MMKNKQHIINIMAWLLCLLVISCQQDEIMQPTLQKHTATSNSSIASRSVTCEVTSEAGSLMDKLDEIANSGGYAKEEITELTIKGTVNYEDLRALRPFPKMTKLDMTNMTIVDSEGNINTEFPSNSLDSLQSPAHVYLPTYLSGIRSHAFYDSKIVAVEMSDNLWMLDSYSFESCKDLHTVKLSNNIEEIYYGAFEGCNSLTTINVPSKLKLISGAAFNGCAFSSFIIPETVETIEWNAFSNNPNLENVNNWPTKVTEIPGACFMNCPKLRFEIPNHVTTIGSNAFDGCTMSVIKIPESVENIQWAAFANNPKLVSINWPSKVTEIPGACFSECQNLVFDIPNHITKIGHQAFYHCKSLTTINIPSSVTELESGIFVHCEKLKAVTGLSNLSKIPDSMFEFCYELDFSIPNKIDTIGNLAFNHCYKMSSPIPAELKYIGYAAFNRCTSLPNPQLPISLKHIDREAFYGCDQITKINLLEGVEYIGRYAFNGTSIKELRIPSTVKTIGNEIVANCEYLRVINWETTADMPELFYSWENYGTLIYAKSGINVHPNNKNLILGDDESGYVTERFELVDGKDFYCPKTFTAKQIVFRKHFDVWTDPNKPGGWRTIALPFTVTKFVAQASGDQPERILKPFGTEDMGDAKPFWLRTLHSNGFSRETILEASKPYIICFPNNDQYLPEYNIRGTVEFWGENVTVVDNSQMTPLEGPEYTFYPTFEKIKKSMDIYNIDYNEYYDRMYNIHYAGGSLFRSSIRDTEPYEGYIMNNVTGRAVIAINNQTNGRSIKSFGAVPMEDDM